MALSLLSAHVVGLRHGRSGTEAPLFHVVLFADLPSPTPDIHQRYEQAGADVKESLSGWAKQQEAALAEDQDRTNERFPARSLYGYLFQYV